MNIYRLKYSTKEQAILDLQTKQVIDEETNYINDTQSVVYVGKIIETQGTYNEEGEVITEPTFIDGYHIDIMTKDTIDFGDNEVNVNSPVHNWA